MTDATLCAPRGGLSCFGCCPPIRPPGYDPLDHVRVLRREFAAAREAYRAGAFRPRPVVGFSCWALGFLDASGRRAGCLLHPAGNGGRDLRHLTGYGEKCARELCLAAKVFSDLGADDRRFWLAPALGLSTFWYSSPRANPLFHVLLWGREVLGAAREAGRAEGLGASGCLSRFPFLSGRNLSPRAHRHPAALLLSAGAAPGAIGEALPALLSRTAGLPEARPPQVGPPLPALGLPAPLRDFLLLGLGWRRATLPDAVAFAEALGRLASRGAP